MIKEIQNELDDDLALFYASDEPAKHLLDWFATRQNDSRETAADRAAAVTGLS